MADRYEYDRERMHDRERDRGHDYDRGREGREYGNWTERRGDFGGYGRESWGGESGREGWKPEARWGREGWGGEYRGREEYGGYRPEYERRFTGDWGREGGWAGESRMTGQGDYDREVGWRNEEQQRGRQDWRQGRWAGEGRGGGPADWTRGGSWGGYVPGQTGYGGGMGYGGPGAGYYGGGMGTHAGPLGAPGQYAGRGPKGYQRSDDRIREDVCERLTQHPQVDASNIEVQVRNGEVTLAGSVDEREQKRVAEDVAEDVFGIKEIHNQIKVQPKPVGAAHGSPQQVGQGRTEGR